MLLIALFLVVVIVCCFVHLMGPSLRACVLFVYACLLCVRSWGYPHSCLVDCSFVCLLVCLFCFHWVLPMFHIGPSQHVVYCLLLYVAMGPLPHVMSFCVLFFCLFMGSSPHVFYSRGPIHAVVWGHPHFFHGVLSSETLLLGLASSPGKSYYLK